MRIRLLIFELSLLCLLLSALPAEAPVTGASAVSLNDKIIQSGARSRVKDVRPFLPYMRLIRSFFLGVGLYSWPGQSPRLSLEAYRVRHLGSRLPESGLREAAPVRKMTPLPGPSRHDRPEHIPLPHH